MNAPAEYVVCRHKISHPAEAIAEQARHLRLHYSVVKAVEGRLENEQLAGPQDFVNHALRLARRVDHEPRFLYLPNPEHWFKSYRGKFLESGERVAADVDGLNILPEHFLVYVPREDLGMALRAAIDNFGRLAPPKRANLEIRVQDPWLRSDGDRPIVERGQRLIDYEENPQIRMARRLTPSG